jgi:hypothetical protein
MLAVKYGAAPNKLIEFVVGMVRAYSKQSDQPTPKGTINPAKTRRRKPKQEDVTVRENRYRPDLEKKKEPA